GSDSDSEAARPQTSERPAAREPSDASLQNAPASPEEDSRTAPVLAVLSKWTQAESDSDEESDTVEKAPTFSDEKEKPVSAADLLNSFSAPKFLSTVTGEGFSVKPMATNRFDKIDSERNAPKTAPHKPHSAPVKAQAPAPSAHTSATLATSKKAPDSEKIDSAKDRVKRQRLNGQSGIGTDFKSWKSEEEMRQRQMYD
ncbi:hypothetical protein B484DRAFT_429868, partial [Ochromonadaceae sp. CCMP2298]